jgi:reverse gyrase
MKHHPFAKNCIYMHSKMLCMGFVQQKFLEHFPCHKQALEQGLEAGRDSIKELVQKEQQLNDAAAVQVSWKERAPFHHCYNKHRFPSVYAEIQCQVQTPSP